MELGSFGEKEGGKIQRRNHSRCGVRAMPLFSARTAKGATARAVPIARRGRIFRAKRGAAAKKRFVVQKICC